MKDLSSLPELLLFLLLFSYTPTAAAQAPGTFIPTGNMTTPRTLHTATLLLNGKVLITGGATRPGSPALASAELFDPNTGTFTATGNMTTRHISPSATLLADGRVLITGGNVLDGVTGAFANLLGVAELYDPSTGTFAATGNMVRPQAGNTSTLLNSGKVLISGTCQDWFYIDADAEGDRPELYDPGNATFASTGDMAVPRAGHTATLLMDGRVLMAGGTTADFASAQLYVPSVLPVQAVVSDLRFDQTSVVAGSSYSLSVSGSNLTSETFLDVRFISPEVTPPMSS